MLTIRFIFLFACTYTYLSQSNTVSWRVEIGLDQGVSLTLTSRVGATPMQAKWIKLDLILDSTEKAMMHCRTKQILALILRWNPWNKQKILFTAG